MKLTEEQVTAIENGLKLAEDRLNSAFVKGDSTAIAWWSLEVAYLKDMLEADREAREQETEAYWLEKTERDMRGEL